MNTRSEDEKKEKMLYFEGLRGIAALLVFFVHFVPVASITINNPSLFPQNDGTLENLILNFKTELLNTLTNGDLPVYIFWLMSAYVLTYWYYKIDDPEKRKTFIQKSTIKRYFRLLIPVATASLIAFALMKFDLFYNKIATPHRNDINQSFVTQWFNFEPSYFLFTKTTLIDVFMSGNSNYNPVLWSISPEFLGSLLSFSLLALFGFHKNENKILFIICATLILSGLFTKTYFYYLPFALGLFLAKTNYEIKLLRGYTPAIIIILTSYLIPAIIRTYFPHINYNYIFLFETPLKAFGILTLITNSSTLKRLLSTKLMVYLGKISFSFYLLHFIILMSLGAFLFINLPQTNSKPFIILTCCLSISILASILFERYIDRTSKDISNKIAKFISGN